MFLVVVYSVMVASLLIAPLDVWAVSPDEHDVIKARVTVSAPTAGQDIVVTVTLDTAAPSDNQFSVQLHTCDQGYSYINELNLCSGNKGITHDDIVPTHTIKSKYGDPPTNHYIGVIDIKNGTTTGTLSFGTTWNTDGDQEYLLVSVIPILDRDDEHPFYSLYNIREVDWVDQATPAVGKIHGYALWKTSILPLPDTVVRIFTSSSGNEGEDVTFFINAKPAPSSPLTVNAAITQVGSFVPSEYIGTRTIIIPTSGSATVVIPTTNNDIVDEADGVVTLTLKDGQGYVLSPSQKMLSVDVQNDDDGKPVWVSLTTRQTSILENREQAA